MLALAQGNQKKSGVHNAEFLKGTMEEIPLPEKSADMILSNWVICACPPGCFDLPRRNSS